VHYPGVIITHLVNWFENTCHFYQSMLFESWNRTIWKYTVLK